MSQLIIDKKKSDAIRRSIAFVKESTKDLKRSVKQINCSECFFINGKYMYLSN